MKKNKINYLVGLSWLRFMLALYLVIFHTIKNYPNIPDWIIAATSAGYVSTSLFFILSGFILTHVYYGPQGSLKTTKTNFLVTRFFTLYPLHLLGFSLAALIMFLQYMAVGQVLVAADLPLYQNSSNSEEFITIVIHAPEVLFNALMHLLTLQAWNPLYSTFNIPSWSISALIFFYVIFAFSGKYLIKLKRPFLGLLFLNLLYLIPPLYFIYINDYGNIATGILHTNPLVRIPEFLSGVLLHTVMQKIQWPKIKLVPFLISLVLLISIQVLMIRLLMKYEAAGFYLAHNGALLFVQLALVALFSKMPVVPFEKFNKLIDRLGNATLSIFVLHLPLFYLFSKLEKIIKLNLAPDSSMSFFQRLKEVELSLALYPLIITAIIIICVFTQENFVLKVRHPLRRFVERVYSTTH